VTASELMEQGIRAYTRGQLGEAERCWRDVLAVDPQNARAQSYLELLVGKLVGTAAAPASAAPVPLPAPAAQPPAPPQPPPRSIAPVPLPAPAAAAWMQAPAAPPAAVVGPAAVPPAAAVPAAVAPAANPTAPDEFASCWEGDPAGFAPAANPVTLDEFASCWEGDRGEITAPITTELSLSLEESGDVPRIATLTPSASLPASPSLPAPSDRTTLSEYAPSPWDEGPARSPAVVLDDGVGLDFATVSEQSGLRSLVPEAIGQAVAQAPRSEVEIWMEGARELFALGDFSGSLEMIEKILRIHPSHAEAREYLKQNEATLIAMYESKLGPADATPVLAIQPEEVMWLNLDHRAGFLLAQIDGGVSYEDLFALSGLPRLDTARILATLLQEGVIKSL